jgi:REP element-mobilizing transposase RayT
VPKLQHYYGLNHLHYLTNSTYRRARLYDSERFRNQWVVTLGDLRRELGFKITGYVLILNYMHNNPVKRGLVKEPSDWPWSSWRFCFLNDTSLLATDPVP